MSDPEGIKSALKGQAIRDRHRQMEKMAWSAWVAGWTAAGVYRDELDKASYERTSARRDASFRSLV